MGKIKPGSSFTSESIRPAPSLGPSDSTLRARAQNQGQAVLNVPCERRAAGRSPEDAQLVDGRRRKQWRSQREQSHGPSSKIGTVIEAIPLLQIRKQMLAPRPVSLLQAKNRPRLVEALFESTRHWRMSLHFNKGLAGAPAEEIAAARDTAMNPGCWPWGPPYPYKSTSPA
jgi:hypothetical protein